MAAESFIPPVTSAPAGKKGRVRFGFGPRFQIALLLGLLLLIPAWWDSRFILAMFLWDAVVAVAWAVDLARMPNASRIEAERRWEQPLSLGYEAKVTLSLHNSSSDDLEAFALDETPTSLSDAPPEMQLALPSGGDATHGYAVVPRRRGDIDLGNLYLRLRSRLGLAERWAQADLRQSVRVLPDLLKARNAALYLIRSRQVDLEKRRQRLRGLGREFEALREYRKGDDVRDICWSATGRRHQLITRTYQIERSQPVWIVLDAGRLMRARLFDQSRGIEVAKLDCAVDAALSLAQVALQSGDRVGLLAYGRDTQQLIGLGRGSRHLRTMINALAQVHSEAAEADHTRAVRTLLQKQSRRSLIVWISDFAETATTPEVIEHALLMTRRHLVLFAAVTQADLIQLTEKVPESEEEMYRHAAALEVSQRRERLLRTLRERGVLAADVTPLSLTDEMINRYLEVKDRNLL